MTVTALQDVEGKLDRAIYTIQNVVSNVSLDIQAFSLSVRTVNRVNERLVTFDPLLQKRGMDDFIT